MKFFKLDSYQRAHDVRLSTVKSVSQVFPMAGKWQFTVEVEYGSEGQAYICQYGGGSEGYEAAMAHRKALMAALEADGA